MKKIIIGLLVLIVTVSVHAQLVETYPNSQRYLFNEYNHDSLPIDSIPGVTVIYSGSWYYTYNIDDILAQKYFRERSDSVVVYGVALPITIYKDYGSDYIGMDYRWRENDSLWNSMYGVVLDSITGNSNNNYAYLHKYNAAHSEFLDLVDSVRMQRGVSIVNGNEFQFPNLGNWSEDTVFPYSLRVPVVEVYFKEPHIMFDSFWVGTKSIEINISFSDYVRGFGFGLFAIYDKSGFDNIYDIDPLLWRRKANCYWIVIEHRIRQLTDGLDFRHLWGGPFPIVTPPPCMQPCSLRVESIHFDSVRVQWDVPVRVGVCRVEYGPAGFALGTGTVIDSVWGGECLIGGLQPRTAYDVYVSGWCKDQECWSGWTDTSFTTDEACPTKFSYGINAVTDTSMHVWWRVPEGAVYSEAWYGVVGCDWSEGTNVTPVYPDASGMCHLQIAGLTSGTSYSVKIRHWCEYGDVYSEWVTTGATTIAYYTVTAVPNNAQWGSVTGGGEYLAGSQATLRANPANEYCRFVTWDDGVTYRTRALTVTCDTTFRALFVCDTCTESIEEAGTSAVTLTPNPAHGEVTVTSDATIHWITIHDMQGRKVAELTPESQATTIPLSHLPQGTYIITIHTDQTTATRKIVKM